MTVVGMLHHRRNPEKVNKAYAFAAVSLMEGIEFYYFSYSSVDFKKGKIKGWIYKNGQWTQVDKKFPDVVINCSSPKTKAQSNIRKKLKEKTIFTSYPVGHKMKVYKKLLRDGRFAPYLIPSALVSKTADVFSFLEKNQKAVMKPIKGNHGRNVLIIDQKDNIHLIDGEKVKELTNKEFEQLLKVLLNERKWLIQPFIKSVTKADLAYDFRLHTQKNGEGLWEITLIYPRISGGKKKVCNVSSGGYRGELIPFLMEEFPECWALVKEKLEQFALQFSTHFENLYNHSFDELGIDVGMDENGKLWLFEVNWRPGSRHREFDVAKKLIPYCHFLANQ